MEIKSRLLQYVRILLRILLLSSTCLYPLFMAQMTAAGWRYQVTEGHYPAFFSAYAFWMTAGGILMTVGTVLCMLGISRRLWGCNPAAILCSGGGMTACLITLFRFCAYADQNFSGIGADLMPVSEMYRDRILPVIVPFVLVCILAAWQFFAYESRVYRKQKRDERQRKENAPAPSILG